jgi:hypothetical protein
MVTLLPVVLARDQLRTPFGGSMLVEQADIRDKIRVAAKAVLILLKVVPFYLVYFIFRAIQLADFERVPYHASFFDLISLNGLIPLGQYNNV